MFFDTPSLALTEAIALIKNVLLNLTKLDWLEMSEADSIGREKSGKPVID